MRGASPAPAQHPSTRSAAARGYPGCTRGQDAADAARHCNTQPVCWPPREPSRRPPGGHRSSWSRPPSSGASRGAGSFHPSGLSPSKRDRSGASPGGLPSQGQPWGQLWALCPPPWGSAGLPTRLSFWEVRFSPGLSRCQGARPQAGDHPLFQGRPRASWTACPWQAQQHLNCPWGWKAAGLGPGKPALCSGVDLLCDFWMSHLASLGFISSSWEVGRIESGLRMLVWGRSQVQETLTRLHRRQ